MTPSTNRTFKFKAIYASATVKCRFDGAVDAPDIDAAEVSVKNNAAKQFDTNPESILVISLSEVKPKGKKNA